MATPAKQPYDESLVNLYEDQFLSQADTAYRFAFALTLSLDGANLCVRKAFKHIADQLPKYARADDSAASVALIGSCWRAYQDIKGQKFAVGQSATITILAPLPIEARAALVAIDVAGLSPAEAAQALQMSDKDLRVHLAHARQTLLRGTAQL